MRDLRWLVAIHEAGHTVMAWVLGWHLGLASCIPVGEVGGCTVHKPAGDFPGADEVDITAPPRFTFWPTAVKGGFEEMALVAAAGIAAETVLIEQAEIPAMPAAPRPRPRVARSAAPGEVPPEVPAATPELVAEARELIVNPRDVILSDLQRLRSLGKSAHKGDPATASAWTLYLQYRAAAHIRDLQTETVRLAQALYVAGVMSGEGAAGVLTGVTSVR